MLYVDQLDLRWYRYDDDSTIKSHLGGVINLNASAAACSTAPWSSAMSWTTRPHPAG